MAYYRLYMMDGLTGHVTSFIEIEAGTDAEAVGRAEAQRANVAMELWCGRKKVKRWSGNSRPTPNDQSADLPE